MAVKTIAEQVVVLHPVEPEPLEPPVPEPPQPSPSASVEPDAAAKARAERADAIFSTMGVVAKILAARMILLLAMVGAFVLALVVVSHPGVPAIITMGVYDAFVFVPLAVLAIWKG